MGSIFATGKAPVFSKEQQKQRKLAWKPNSAHQKANEDGEGIVLYRSPKAQAEYEARLAAEAQAKAEKRAATLAKMAATRAAKSKGQK